MPNSKRHKPHPLLPTTSTPSLFLPKLIKPPRKRRLLFYLLSLTFLATLHHHLISLSTTPKQTPATQSDAAPPPPPHQQLQKKNSYPEVSNVHRNWSRIYCRSHACKVTNLYVDSKGEMKVYVPPSSSFLKEYVDVDSPVSVSDGKGVGG
ncbi:hypothetical protein HDV05_000570, partial [Chytridiales sp. JEL 0842]